MVKTCNFLLKQLTSSLGSPLLVKQEVENTAIVRIFWCWTHSRGKNMQFPANQKVISRMGSSLPVKPEVENTAFVRIFWCWTHSRGQNMHVPFKKVDFRLKIYTSGYNRKLKIAPFDRAQPIYLRRWPQNKKKIDILRYKRGVLVVWDNRILEDLSSKPAESDALLSI